MRTSAEMLTRQLSSENEVAREMAGFIGAEVLRFALIAFPATLFGAWIGARTYHALSDRNFSDVVLGLLFLSGIGLVWSNFGWH